MTKVLKARGPIFLLAGCLAAVMAAAQPAPTAANCPATATALYARLRSIGLDEHRVYRVRGASIDRPSGSATTRPRRPATEVVHDNQW